MVPPGFRGGFRPGFPVVPLFRFDPRFRGGMFTPGFVPRFPGAAFDRRFDRFEDRFERRFDRFEDRFDTRSHRGMIHPDFDGRVR
jgi:hypothetical protein